MKRIGSAAAFLASLLASCATPAPAPAPFEHLDVAGSAIRTAPPLAFTVSGFRAAAPSHRRADFGGHPYEVSLAALLGTREAVMVHAERVADASGASDYDDLPRTGWPTPAFGLRSACVAVDSATVAAEHDLAWLRDRGWDPAGTVAMDQYLATTPDHNREVVISLLVRGIDCADQPAVRAALDSLRNRIAVRNR
jgi:hypothetical protein